MSYVYRVRLFTLTFFCVIVFCSLDSKSACVCPDGDNGIESSTNMTNEHTVFLGRVNRVKFINSHDYIAKIKVINLWKSINNLFSNSKYLYVGSTLSDQECGVELTLGHTYLVYAKYNGTFLLVDSCSKTKALNIVTEQEINVLGKPIVKYEDNLSD